MDNKTNLNLSLFTEQTSQVSMALILSNLYSLLSLVESRVDFDGKEEKLVWTFFNRKDKDVDVLVGNVTLAECRYLVDGNQISAIGTAVMITKSRSTNIYIYSDGFGGKFQMEKVTLDKAAQDIIKNLKNSG